MTTYRRRAWGARKARSGGWRINPLELTGVVLHWPAMAKPLRTVPAVMAALRGWQDYHMDGHGWSDIAYTHAIDQAGNRYRLRGALKRSAANGDTALNKRYLAILLVLAEGEEPSPEMIKATRKLIGSYRRRWWRCRAILGHGQVRSGGTACPGPEVMHLINMDAFQP